MKIEKGKYYFLRMKLAGRELEYKCKVIDVSKDRLKIVDHNGERLNFNTSNLIHFEEIDKAEVESESTILKTKKC
jgi:FKBP-type peptidyl-prolyl cis-trans isomerase 2